MRSHLSNSSILKLVDGIFTSKIRYGLQLYGKVRMTEEDQQGKDFKAIQLIQNALLRVLNGTRIIDSVNQELA